MSGRRGWSEADCIAARIDQAMRDAGLAVGPTSPAAITARILDAVASIGPAAAKGWSPPGAGREPPGRAVADRIAVAVDVLKDEGFVDLVADLDGKIADPPHDLHIARASGNVQGTIEATIEARIALAPLTVSPGEGEGRSDPSDRDRPVLRDRDATGMVIGLSLMPGLPAVAWSAERDPGGTSAPSSGRAGDPVPLVVDRGLDVDVGAERIRPPPGASRTASIEPRTVLDGADAAGVADMGDGTAFARREQPAPRDGVQLAFAVAAPRAGSFPRDIEIEGGDESAEPPLRRDGTMATGAAGFYPSTVDPTLGLDDGLARETFVSLSHLIVGALAVPSDWRPEDGAVGEASGRATLGSNMLAVLGTETWADRLEPSPGGEAFGALRLLEDVEPTRPPGDVPVKDVPAKPLGRESLDGLIARGRESFRQGDLDSARLFFTRAWEGGDRRGAEWMSRTYDPEALAGMPLLGGLHVDRALARSWRLRAGP